MNTEGLLETVMPGRETRDLLTAEQRNRSQERLLLKVDLLPD